MKNTLSISVIIPCYNCINSIDRAMESIVNQTCLPKEVILIEDKTPDDGLTLKCLLDIQRKYNTFFNIKLIQLEKNSGPASARNAGWKEASGKYIAFLDSDDSWHSQKLELQYNWMEQNPNVFLSGHELQIKLENSVQDPKYTDLQDNQIIKITDRKILLSNQFSTPTIMLRNNSNIYFHEGQRAAEDYYLWLKLILTGLPASRISLPLAFSYKEHFGEAGLSSNLWEMEKGELRCYKQIYKDQLIDFLTLQTVSLISLSKFLRRILIVKILR